MKIAIRYSVIISLFAFLGSVQDTWTNSTHAYPNEQQLLTALLKNIQLSPNNTVQTASTLTLEQQDDLFCALLDVIMNPDDRTAYATIRSVFQKYCSSFQQSYPKVYENFTKPKVKGLWSVVKLMQTYNGLNDHEIPPHAREKRKRDRIAFDKKYLHYWDQYSVMSRIAKKFK